VRRQRTSCHLRVLLDMLCSDKDSLSSFLLVPPFEKAETTTVGALFFSHFLAKTTKKHLCNVQLLPLRFNKLYESPRCLPRPLQPF
jgi:hypothetical protein